MITGISGDGYNYKRAHDGLGTTLSFDRDADGRLILKADNATAAYIEGVGTISGDGQLKFTITDEDSNISAFEYMHEGEDEASSFTLDNADGVHYNIKGDHVNLKSQSGGADRTIQVDANNSNIDLGKAGGSQFVYLSEESHDNKTTLGYGNDNYIDAGQFNYSKAKGGNNRFESTADSHGSVMIGGSGADTFMIGGKYGVFDGGAGNDTFEALGLFGESSDASYRNVIIGGDGDDTVTDKGGYNIFFGGNGRDAYSVSGQSGIAFLGEDGEEGGIIGSSADKSYIFTTEETTIKGRTYKLSDIMKRYSWTLYEFLNVYSQISGVNNNSLASHGVIDEETMQKLEEYFQNNLQK